MSYTVYDPTTGRIIRSGHAAPDDVALQAREGEAVIPVSVRDDTHYIDTATKEAVKKADRPSDHHSFDYASKLWVLQSDGLQKAKHMRVAMIQSAYEKERAALTVQSGPHHILADRLSYMLVMGALVTTPDVFEWRTISGERVLLSNVEIRNLASAMNTAICQIYKKFLDKKDTINAATTLEQVDGVSW